MFHDIVRLHRLGDEVMDEVVERAHDDGHIVTFWGDKIYEQELAVALGTFADEVEDCDFEKLLLPVYLEGGVAILEKYVEDLDFDVLSNLVVSIDDDETPIILCREDKKVGIIGVSGCPWIKYTICTKFDSESKVVDPVMTPRIYNL